MKDIVPLIVGEWSVGISPQTLAHARDEVERKAYQKLVANLLLLAFNEADGWFFWNYKLSDQSTEKHPGWSFKNMVESGFLPF
jgi:hypothetical protein